MRTAFFGLLVALDFLVSCRVLVDPSGRVVVYVVVTLPSGFDTVDILVTARPPLVAGETRAAFDRLESRLLGKPDVSCLMLVEPSACVVVYVVVCVPSAFVTVRLDSLIGVKLLLLAGA
jgi:hypothetical protein